LSIFSEFGRTRRFFETSSSSMKFVDPGSLYLMEVLSSIWTVVNGIKRWFRFICVWPYSGLRLRMGRCNDVDDVQFCNGLPILCSLLVKARTPLMWHKFFPGSCLKVYKLVRQLAVRSAAEDAYWVKIQPNFSSSC
jgi:hypothetical protein